MKKVAGTVGAHIAPRLCRVAISNPRSMLVCIVCVYKVPVENKKLYTTFFPWWPEYERAAPFLDFYFFASSLKAGSAPLAL